MQYLDDRVGTMQCFASCELQVELKAAGRARAARVPTPYNKGVYLNDRWWVRDQVKFHPFQTSERLKTFGDLIFMIFLH